MERSQGTPAYRGSIELIKGENGILVINEVLLEEYLYAVVPSEMPASYPLEALKSQAVCARTYAYDKMCRAGLPAYGAHVDDSAAFQVYNNIEENADTTRAVKETAGLALFTKGSRRRPIIIPPPAATARMRPSGKAGMQGTILI